MRVYLTVPASMRVTVEAQGSAQLSLEFPSKGGNPPRLRALRPLNAGKPREVFVWPGVRLIIEDVR